MNGSRLSLLLGVLLLAGGSADAELPLVGEDQLLTGLPAAEFHAARLALDEDTLIIGASEGEALGTDSGGLWVAERDAAGIWGVPTLITPSTAGLTFLGGEVALSGDTAAAWALDGSAARVLLFERDLGGTDNWGESTSIAAPAGGSLFGRDLFLDGDVLFVGERSVALHVYERDLGGAGNWGLLQAITPPVPEGVVDGWAGDFQAQGSEVFISNPVENGLAGALYQFERAASGSTPWSFVQKLPTPPGALLYGTDLSWYGDELAVLGYVDVSILGRDVGGTNQWGLIQDVTPSVPPLDELTNGPIELDDGIIVISQLGYPEPSGSSSRSFVWRRDATGVWVETEKILPGGVGLADSGFGSSLAIGGGQIIAAAPGEFGLIPGNVYVFDIVPRLPALPALGIGALVAGVGGLALRRLCA